MDQDEPVKPENGATKKRRVSTSGQYRTLKACSRCRRQKTKCLKASNTAVTCVRCSTLSVTCSLELEYKKENPNVRIINGIPEHLLDAQVENAAIPLNLIPTPDHNGSELGLLRKIDLVYSGVAEMLAILKNQPRGENNIAPGHLVNNDVRLLLEAANSMKKKSQPVTPSAFIEGLPPATPGYFPTHTGKLGFSTSLLPPIAHTPTLHDAQPVDLELDASLFISSSKSFRSAPLHMVTKTLTDVPRPFANLVTLNPVLELAAPQFDIISCGILTENEAVALMDDFRSNYGRWVSFPLQISTADLIKQIRKRSSLLLTTCCSISLRYSLNVKPSPGDIDNHRRKKDTYGAIIRHLMKDLNKVLLRYASFQGSKGAGGDVEFLQSMVILSIYLFSLSSIVANTIDPELILEDESDLRDLNLDPWYLSSLGLSLFVSKLTFGTLLPPAPRRDVEGANFSPPFTLMDDGADSDDSQMLTLLRIYNHLILIHLVSCVLSGRMCLVDEIRLNYCITALSLPSATNFDGRMVSEIGILLIAYNFIQMNLSSNCNQLTQLEANLQTVNEEVQAWYDQWEYLFDQPAVQFVEFCYDFCCLQILLNYTYCKDQVLSKKSERLFEANDLESIEGILSKADKTQLIKILYHSYTLVNFVTRVDDDSYFAYLSDQIHFFFFYGAIVLVTILKYIAEHDKLDHIVEAQIGEFDEKNYTLILDPVTLLVEKYARVAQENANDIITKYRNGIVECIQRQFPDE